jgi:hypothetical protein
MSRKAWIAILGFCLLLFTVLYPLLVSFAVKHQLSASVFGVLATLLLAKWITWIALKRKIDSKSDTTSRSIGMAP